VVEELGADAYVYGIADADGKDADAITAGTDVVVRIEARRAFERGQTVHVTAKPEDVHVFATESGERLGKRR
jgi:multiple sugar transport system ATP-binding protein